MGTHGWTLQHAATRIYSLMDKAVGGLDGVHSLQHTATHYNTHLQATEQGGSWAWLCLQRSAAGPCESPVAVTSTWTFFSREKKFICKLSLSLLFRARAHSLSPSHALSLALTRSLSPAFSHSLSLTLSLSLTFSHSLSLTHSLSPALSHSHTFTRSLSSFSVCLSVYRSVCLSRYLCLLVSLSLVVFLSLFPSNFPMRFLQTNKYMNRSRRALQYNI